MAIHQPASTERICITCERSAPLDDFYKHRSRGRVYLDSRCKPCRLEFQRGWQPSDPTARQRAKAISRRRFHLLRTYGLDPDDFEAMVERQHGRCANPGCGVKFDRTNPRRANSIYIDHDHATGTVRGLLCLDCNVGLGRLHDSPRRISGLLAYLGVAP